MQEVAEVSRKNFSIAYNGQDKTADHSIDVDLLAPALLAFGKLIREANKEINGKSAKANIFVVSDFEHKCFNINFEVVLTVYEQLKTLIGTQDAKNAKEILEWLGILVSTGGLGFGLLKYLAWRRGRNIESVKEVRDSDQSGKVSVRIEGENNPVIVHNHVWNLSNNPKALQAARDTLSPMGIDGFDSIEIREDDKIVEKIEQNSADGILASCNKGIQESKELAVDIDETTAWLTVYSPVYEETADRWRFKLGRDVIYADISECLAGN